MGVDRRRGFPVPSVGQAGIGGAAVAKASASFTAPGPEDTPPPGESPRRRAS